MNITIFGSCRQNSLVAYFNVTPIRDHLTYSHYSKEILQAAQFCKGDLQIPSDVTQYLFRSSILQKKPILLSFQGVYDKTDLFVVEIASRNYYKYKGYYTHHIAVDPDYAFCDSSQIEIGQVSDEEIEQDLLELRQVFYPKPFIVVTHIYTRTSGSRYELVQLIKRLCTKHNIYVFDPVEQTQEYSSDILYVKDDILSHYTQEGHQIIGKKYAECISNMMKDYRLFSSIRI